MKNELEKIRKLRRTGNLGIYKKWVLKSNHDYDKVCEYLQKISFCIQDLDEEISSNKELLIKNIVYIITLTTWIQEAFKGLIKLYREDIINEFHYSKSDELSKAEEYLKAIRSFVLAHPLSTNRHKEFGFDGKFVCMDIHIRINSLIAPFVPDDHLYHVNFDGIFKNEKNYSNDFVLYCYLNSATTVDYLYYIGCSMSDIYRASELYIDKLYLLDRYLSKQKRSDYKVMKNEA